ncbi:LmeA family phospholipid-binding protein [Streptomyces sp. NPDC002851]
MRMRTPLILLGTLAVLAVGGDLAAEQIAENIAADKVGERLPGQQGSAEVDIKGFPFLTQAVTREFDEITITVKDAAAPAGSATVTLPRATLTARGVKVEGMSSAVAQLVEGQATVPYSALASALEQQNPSGGPVEIAPVTGGATRVRITQGGKDLIARLSGQGADIAFTPEVEGAPPQTVAVATGPLRADITGATPDDDGVRLHFAGRLVSLG